MIKRPLTKEEEEKYFPRTVRHDANGKRIARAPLQYITEEERVLLGIPSAEEVLAKKKP